MPLSRARLAGIPRRLWRLVSLARHRLLMLDYDGTLAPFRVRRDEARPLPKSLERLQELSLADHTHVAIVSGRPVHEVEKLLGALPVSVVGEHGWERRLPSGEMVRWPVPPRARQVLDAAESATRELGYGHLLECKRTALVLHTRGLEPAESERVQTLGRTLWASFVGGDLVLDRISGGLEIRVRGRNKGTAVLSLLSQAQPGTLGTFVGDDVSDEDALEVVQERGFGVRVGGPRGDSVAQGYLESPHALPDFLGEWLRVAARVA